MFFPIAEVVVLQRLLPRRRGENRSADNFVRGRSFAFLGICTEWVFNEQVTRGGTVWPRRRRMSGDV